MKFGAVRHSKCWQIPCFHKPVRENIGKNLSEAINHEDKEFWISSPLNWNWGAWYVEHVTVHVPYSGLVGIHSGSQHEKGYKIRQAFV